MKPGAKLILIKIKGVQEKMITQLKSPENWSGRNKRDERQAEQEIPVMKMSRGHTMNIILLYQNEYF